MLNIILKLLKKINRFIDKMFEINKCKYCIYIVVKENKFLQCNHETQWENVLDVNDWKKQDCKFYEE